jgi:hypothetical protein
MPRKSERGEYLEEIGRLQESVLLHENGEKRRKLFNQLMRLEIEVCSHRYMERPTKYKQTRTTSWFLNWLTDQQILVYCKMSRSTFEYIEWTVSRDGIWEVGLGFRSQYCRKFQVFVALARLSSADQCIDKLVALLQISHGTVINFAERFIAAILKVEKCFVKWPSPERREQLASWGETEHGFHGFIGSMDGTHCYFRRSPAFQMFPEAYMDTWHKGGYGYNCLLTADHTGSIIAYLIGWPGGQNDKVLQPMTALHSDPWKFLKKGEQFLFVDSGFARTMYCVPPYPGKAGKLPHNKEFNFAMRQARSRIEHVNAILKGRLASLNSIPIDIDSNDDHDRAQNWIRACIILHNVYVRRQDKWEFEASDSDSDSDSSSESDGSDNEWQDCSGFQFQNAIRDRYLRSQGWR